MSGALTGQVAVVTGASSGLGRRFAQLLAQAGAAVALMARRTDRLAEAVSEIEANGGRAIALPLDVSDAQAIGPAFDEVQNALGSISILVNNAGFAGAGMALELSIEEWDRTYDTNVRGVFFAAREAARRMIDSGVAAAGNARIINIASVLATTVDPGVSAYCGSKAAVVALTRALAREWAREQIAVNALCPGYIETEINADWFATELGERQIKRFPRRRLVDQVALDEPLLMLAGPGARYLSGTLITVDDAQTL